MEQLKKDVLTLTMKAGEEVSTLKTSLQQPQKRVAAFNKGKKAALQTFRELRDKTERAEYGEDGLELEL